jgi:hypothetical protein
MLPLANAKKCELFPSFFLFLRRVAATTEGGLRALKLL